MAIVGLNRSGRHDNRRAKRHNLGANRHLGFGLGIHYCLDAPPARIAARIASATVLRRLPSLALAVPAEQLRWHTNPILCGVKRLPVRWDV